MRISINASILRAPHTGIGHYLIELARALATEPDLELQFFTGWNWQAELPAATMPGYSGLSWLFKRAMPNPYAMRRWMEQRRFNKTSTHADIYHDPSLWPLDFDGPMVMTLHDLTHVHFPQTQPVDRLAEIERRVGQAVARAQCILVDSQFIADDVCAHYGLPAKRVVVAPLGCAERFSPRDPAQLAPRLATMDLLPGGYLLFVGTLEPRKNLQLVLRSYERLPAALRARYPLVIAGMPGWRMEQLSGPLQRALVSGQVRLLGYQDDTALAELYAGARLLLFPSLYEGFGLPVLEAMASGTPVILGRVSALPEIAGDAGLYANPHDELEWVAGIQSLIEDQVRWECMREAGWQRAKMFSWQRCAQTTAGVYRQLVAA